jgi:hypothetical protein
MISGMEKAYIIIRMGMFIAVIGGKMHFTVTGYMYFHQESGMKVKWYLEKSTEKALTFT